MDVTQGILNSFKFISCLNIVCRYVATQAEKRHKTSQVDKHKKNKHSDIVFFAVLDKWDK